METSILPVKTPAIRAKERIAQHPLIAFYILAFAVTWVIDFLIPQSNGLSTLGSYGPFFAAVALSAILRPEEIRASGVKRWALFALIFAVAMAAWVFADRILAIEPSLLSGVLPSAAIAFLASGALSNTRGVRELLSLPPWRSSWPWYLAALLLGPAIWLLPIVLDLAFGGQLAPWPRGTPTLAVVLACFGWVMFFDGATEEPGWRGFALPRMQLRFTPLVASIILGVFWSLWHLPLYFVGMYTASSSTGPAGIFGILSRFGWVIPLAMIFTWLYNRSGRSSLPTMVLLHASFNTATAVVGLSARATLFFMGTTWAIAILLILIGRMWRKIPPVAPTAPDPAL